MNRRHWLYTIAATIAAAFLSKSDSGLVRVKVGTVDEFLSDFERVKAYIDERLKYMS